MQLCQLLGISDTGSTLASFWLKFAYKGKILFIPDGYMSNGWALSTLYDLGLVYGEIPEAEWPAYIKTTYGVKPQGRRIEWGGREYSVRIPRSRVNGTLSDANDLVGGEWDMTVGSAFVGRLYPNLSSTFDDLVATSQYSMTGDITGTSMIIRGSTGGDTQTTLSVISASGYWRPVLELIP